MSLVLFRHIYYFPVNNVSFSFSSFFPLYHLILVNRIIFLSIYLFIIKYYPYSIFYLIYKLWIIFNSQLLMSQSANLIYFLGIFPLSSHFFSGCTIPTLLAHMVFRFCFIPIFSFVK